MLGEGVEQSLPWRCQWSDGLEPQDQEKLLPPLHLRLATCLTPPSYEVPVGKGALSCPASAFVEAYCTSGPRASA